MPFDEYFTSQWKRRPRRSDMMAAKHRRTWPVSSQYKPSEETMQLWMREGKNGAWFHVRDLAPAEKEMELAAWRANNPGWEFGVKEKVKREQPKLVAKEYGKGYGPPRKKWD